MSESNITAIGKAGHINIYRDPYMDENTILFGWKQKDAPEPGIVYVPNENFKDVKSSPIDADEIAELRAKQKPKKMSEYSFCVCNFSEDGMEEIQKAILNMIEKE